VAGLAVCRLPCVCRVCVWGGWGGGGGRELASYTRYALRGIPVREPLRASVSSLNFKRSKRRHSNCVKAFVLAKPMSYG
jgi:hypothetical protein